MSRDSTVLPFRQPEAIDDPLSELAREGARRMLAQVLIAEADSFVAMWKDLKLPDGRDRVVRKWPWAASGNPNLPPSLPTNSYTLFRQRLQIGDHVLPVFLVRHGVDHLRAVDEFAGALEPCVQVRFIPGHVLFLQCR